MDEEAFALCCNLLEEVTEFCLTCRQKSAGAVSSMIGERELARLIEEALGSCCDLLEEAAIDAFAFECGLTKTALDRREELLSNPSCLILVGEAVKLDFVLSARIPSANEPHSTVSLLSSVGCSGCVRSPS